MRVADDLWVFGYGSLIFRPDFPFVERREGFISGWSRRFWQASPDHRGTPERPGRVATLVASPGACCWGVAYLVAPDQRERVLAYLDARECGGYERRLLPFYTNGVASHAVPHGQHARPAQAVVDGTLTSVLVYIADHSNPNFVGPEETAAIAAQVRLARGFMGPNLDYVSQLVSALADMGAEDAHVFELARALDLLV